MPTLNITVKGTVLYTTQVPHIADNDSLNVPIDAYLGLAEFKQAKQEPVAWYSVKGGFNTCGEGKPLYAAPVRTKDLTDDDLNKLLDYWSEDERSAYGGAWSADAEYVDMKSFARAVIAADRSKNGII